MSPVTIINKSFTAAHPGFFVRRYDLGDARKGFGESGYLVGQVDQQIAVAGRRGITADRDRRRQIGRRCLDDIVGNETAIPEGPQQVIDVARGLVIRDVNVDGIVQLVGFFCETAGKALPRFNA